MREIFLHRAEADSFFRFDYESPFRRDTSIRYDGLKWFPTDLQYCFTSRLYHYVQAETVTVYGTKGEERKQLRYGYFILNFDEKPYRLNVYKYLTSESRHLNIGPEYLAVWFTDATTGKETYHVGRYVEVGAEKPDTNASYSINLNNAYNPYCAYTPMYSCAIPRKEDHLDFPVLAGEMTYHK